MNVVSAKVRSATLWYVVWSNLFLISIVDAILWRPLLANNVGLLVSMGMTAAAALLLMVDTAFLTRKLRQLATVVLILFSMSQIIGWVGAVSVIPAFHGFDFAAYYVASHLIAEHPIESPYLETIDAQGRFVLDVEAMRHPGSQTPAKRLHVPYAIPFIYPPVTAVLMKPLAKLSFYSAYRVWQLLSALLLIISILLALDLGGTRITPKLMLMIGVGLFSYYPAWSDLLYGQIGCFILFFLTASMWTLTKNRGALSAFSYAMATIIKLTPVLAVPILVFHRKWRWLSVYGVALMMVACFSIQQAGWPINRQFMTQVLPSLSCGLPVCTNVSIVAFVQELSLGHVPVLGNVVTNMPRYACGVSRAVAAIIYGLMLLRFWKIRRSSDLVQELALMALLAISLSPISWWHHYTVALLPILYLWCKLRDGEGAMLAALVLVVGTNFVGLVQLLTTNHIAQLVLSPIVPLLTIFFVYTYSAPATSVASPA